MTDFILPDIGEGIVECELVKWLVSEGDLVEEDQPVAEVMTDKALVEIPAPNRGRITRLYYRDGEIAKVHEPLFALAAEGEEEDNTADHPAGDGNGHAAGLGRVTARISRPADSAAAGREDAGDLTLPDIGEGLAECELVNWRVAEGDAFEAGRPLAEVMTERALIEITAPRAGRVHRLLRQAGDTIPAGASLLACAPPEAAPAPSAEPPAQPAETEPTVSPVAAAHPEPDRVPATPAVRRLAREYGLDLSDIQGSGKAGRVLKVDVLAHAEAAGTKAGAAGATSAGIEAESAPVEPGGEVRTVAIRGVRAVMARRMAQAAATIPHFTYGDEVDVTDLLALRERLRPETEARGTPLTLMPFIMKAMALAVAEFPVLNSRINDEVTEIHYQPHCNIGMAVDSQAGLIVPNVKHVERRTLFDIASEVARLTAAARDGRVAQADLQGGTITISNIGALGGTYASPIINAPEVAIVALGKTRRLPRFDADGQLVERAIMTITWAGDHRIIDGGIIARFCNRWKGFLESPHSMLLHLG